MSDYYELLGVEPDAAKDDIRAAYRDALDGASQSERARLNRAWNVLSDPVQRERYDEARSEGWLEDADEEEDADEVEVVPARAGRAGRARQGATGRPTPEPTVVLPAGMRLADKKDRGMALAIDFLILFIIMNVVQLAVLPPILENQYPTQWKLAERVNDTSSALDDLKGQIDKCADGERLSASDQRAAQQSLREADRSLTTINRSLPAVQDPSAALTACLDGQSAGRAERAALRKDSDAIDTQIEKNNDRVKKLQDDFTGTIQLVFAGLLVVFLVILVPITAITGQTVGMKLRKVRVVRVDGSPVGWSGAFLRFLVPLAIALLVPAIGSLAGLFMVLWFIWDRNGQGFHDKLAKTLVVAAD